SEETYAPMAMAGPEQVACALGGDTDRTIAIVSTRSGQVVHRLAGTRGKFIESLAISPDGKTLYFVESHVVWAIPTSEGERQRIAPGDAVAVSPDGKYLVIQSLDSQGTHLSRIDIGGADLVAMPAELGNLRLWQGGTLSPGAIAPDGRIVVP